MRDSRIGTVEVRAVGRYDDCEIHLGSTDYEYNWFIITREQAKVLREELDKYIKSVEQ